MIEPTIITWLLIVFGAITFLPLCYAQLLVLFKPDSRKAKDVLIGKDQEWRDRSHRKSALAFAWSDILILFPLIIIGDIGVLLAFSWGYLVWLMAGAISVYFSIVFWVMEKEYTYPSCGFIAYYTYYWGFFLYWGIGTVIYSIIKLV